MNRIFNALCIITNHMKRYPGGQICLNFPQLALNLIGYLHCIGSRLLADFQANRWLTIITGNCFCFFDRIVNGTNLWAFPARLDTENERNLSIS